jgi:drug/metabolite transporter (DMT)-like permease
LCLFNAIKETSISIATILLYTAPAFVTLLSWIVFKESLTSRKIIALITTLIGSSLVIGMFSGSNSTVSLLGLMLGIGSGLFYALYSIFGKFALQKYNSITVTIYTFIFATIAVIPFCDITVIFRLLSQNNIWLYIIGLGFFSTVMSFVLYTIGLNHVESSRASIIATIEPVVASIISFLVFDEKLTTLQYFGIMLVITAVILVQEKQTKTENTEINVVNY